MLFIALTLSLFLSLFTSWYFMRLYREDNYIQTADSIQIGSQSLEDSYHTLLSNVIDMASRTEFTVIVEDAHKGAVEKYGKNNAMIQDSLSTLTVSHPMLDSVIILGKNGERYSLFSSTLKKGFLLTLNAGWDMNSVHGITWFPTCRSPFTKNNDTIPVIVPIAQMKQSRYLNIVNDPQEADVFIILLLDRQKVEERLALGKSNYADRIMYLTDSSGNNLSMTEESLYFELVSQAETSALISASQNQELRLLADTPNYSLYSRKLNFCNLNLVCIQSKHTLRQRIIKMNTFIILIGLTGLIMMTALALKLSNFVTRPFQQLITNIQDIENDNYNTPCQMKYQDEIGRLNQAINSMYDTIQQQFIKIKQSERAKFRSEIQLLTEQINPHFLYNTLECINMEILNEHKEEASSMILNLAAFLRIGLSYGKEVIPILKELTHVKAYIDIMNHRFSQKIDFQYQIESGLEQINILKSILQPLVENSILHGFSTDSENYGNILLPSISIHISKKDSHLLIEVIDNGCGIDIEKANAALHPETGESKQNHHVGLYNIYQRLSAFYGDVSITFETIPFFSNTVCLWLPFII